MFQKRKVVLTGPAPNRGAGRPEQAPVDALENTQTQHQGLRPSLINSKRCVSTSSRSLDQLLQHGGLPLGTTLLIEEHGATDYASTILKGFCALGVRDQRDGSDTLVVCLGIPGWVRGIPAVGRASKSPAAKDTGEQNKMRIAWRYQLSQNSRRDTTESLSTYCSDLNFKANLTPAPKASEVVHVTGASLADIVAKYAHLLDSLPPNRIVRTVVPNLLHPAVYRDESSLPEILIPFILQLRILSRKYSTALIMSLPLQLYPRTSPVVSQIEALCDAVIELEPFEDTNVQGFTHVHKLAELSERGLDVERRQEYSFRLGRSQFEVAPWGIPVDETEIEKEMF